MKEDLKVQFISLLRVLVNFLISNFYGRLLLLTTIVGLLQSLGILAWFFNWFEQTFTTVFHLLSSNNHGAPLYYWLVIAVTIAILCILYAFDHTSLRLVSGLFYDDFKSGLGKWEFGGEGWKNEKEDGRWLLSVSESGDGGITKRGFNWTDYEFTCETKVINKSAGFIIRAESRNKYLMVQLNLERSEPKLRLHLRLPPSPTRDYDWVVMSEDQIDLPLKTMTWIKTRIVVEGSNLDVFLNNVHCAHYFIADPIRWQEGYRIIGSIGEDKLREPTVDDTKIPYIASINYSAGKVGFRCSGSHEHAHFTNVRVKPLWA